MASASRPSVRPRPALRAAQSLTEDEIADELFKDVDESDIDDSDIDEDYTQPEEIETTDSEGEHVGATRVRMPLVAATQHHSTPPRAQARRSFIPLHVYDTIDESETSESFSGFSDEELENSVTPSASTSFAASAARPAKRRRMGQYGDNEEQIPSCSTSFSSSTVPAPTVTMRASAPGPRIPRRGAVNGSRKAADYWSKDNSVPTPLFGKYMSRDRFLLILRCIHFANNADERQGDRLWRVRHVLNDLIGKFRDYYVPAQKLVIDESLRFLTSRTSPTEVRAAILAYLLRDPEYASIKDPSSFRTGSSPPY
ncbi:piggyBac transposable element-derived protein 4-like [Procambarus clarkii]|uniref:piggyBac transposable element-derived protein 4-like n=1 Tax=Procambarus clarkii TaxID=6728 RepID=UPI003743B75B